MKIISLIIVILVHVYPITSTARSSNRVTRIEKNGKDTQVLKAWFDKKITVEDNIPDSIKLDLSQCRFIDDHGILTDIKPTTPYFSMDCTKELQKKANTNIPIIQRFIVKLVENDNGHYFSQYLNCSLVIIDTVTKTTAINAESFSGIGFFTNQYGEYFIHKNKLHSLGSVILKEKSKTAQIHRFLGVGNCWQDIDPPPTSQTYSFKPYARFDIKKGRRIFRYKVWESTIKNHFLGYRHCHHQPLIEVIDRSDELIEQGKN